MMKMWLVKNGYRVLEAESGEEGVEMAQKERPDLIIMDMMMPGMNGLDATQLIRQDRAIGRTPIVAVSAYGADEYRSIALEAGCNEYVSTPFEPGSLADLIKSLLIRKDQTNAPETDREH
jgi:CheY-like chemotaxis protein